ncbi:MAG: hypothetical protein NTY26_08125, partial [Burkholderiales bacterium]|nr:hypothetical protein [Burkholderiales bacterium]
ACNCAGFGHGGDGVPDSARVLRPAGSPLTSLHQARHPFLAGQGFAPDFAGSRARVVKVVLG